MTKFIIKTFIVFSITAFFILLPVLLFNVFILQNGGCKDIYPSNTKWICALNNKPKIIFTGSSTVLFGVNPVIIADSLDWKEGSIINLAKSAGTPAQNFRTLESVNEVCIDSVKIVFYGLDPWVFSKAYYRYDALTWHDWNSKEFLHAWSERRVSFKRYISENYDAIYRCLSGKSLNNSEIPPLYGAEQLKDIPQNFNSPLSEWFEKDIYGFSSVQFEYLKKIKELCLERGYKLILIYPPRLTQWTNDYNANCSKIKSEYETILAHYMGDTPVIDHTKIFPDSLNGSYFNDGVHMNKNGQQVYSVVLSKYLKSMER